MTGAEKGFLLLTSALGNPERRPLTPHQMKVLGQRVRSADFSQENRDLTVQDMVPLGYGREMAQRIVTLLNEEDLLEHYLRKAKRAGCYPLTKISAGFPEKLQQRLAGECPGCLWLKGDRNLLAGPKVALVGSREIGPEQLQFAKEVGIQAAKQGFALVSGNARGADRAAQNACLEHGGQVICVVADALDGHMQRERVLYISEEGVDCEFSAQRALQRNRIIHALGDKTFVAQALLHKGGTWDGTVKNLQHGWSPVFCYDDGSAAVQELLDMGAGVMRCGDLEDFSQLQVGFLNFLSSDT